MPLDKNYDHAATETRLYACWEQSGAFACDPSSAKPRYTIMMPPPNVTGSLHMGHALTFTLQDVLIRYQRMRGKDVLWQPGTDHAGIATQMVVERQLAAAGNEGRREMGRDAFVEKIWKWKAESGGTITRQLRRLGASCDWSRERFTMDEGLSAAVRRVFVKLYKDGLIYKDNRLVNWDPGLLTAVSDLEVESHDVKSSLWYFKYPIEGSDDFITVATTRPETMLGDTAVAVHPENETLKHLIGRHAVLPLVGRLIPIVGDSYADPEKGTGAVKITPAHDFNDFEVGKRHDLPLINIFDQQARLNDAVPEAYRGLDRFVARKKIVAAMEALGLLDKIEPHSHAVPHSQRSGAVIEPWLSEQWYCNAAALAGPALKAVEDGRTKFVPEQWSNTYYAWMRDIQPWCISRQLWWGHQIPAWYGPDGKYFVAENEEEARAEATAHYGGTFALTRDEDVLDTWFSSGLWAFSTLGWPEPTRELATYYPTDVLVTGHDIIFFWVARMMMMSLYCMPDVPFKTVYIHALILDEKGQKMSKSKGNVIDPLDIIDKYGCDALRFTLAAMSTPGRDIRLAPARIEGNRNFVTKLWNAARFCQINGCAWVDGFDPAAVRHSANQWIVGETAAAAARIAEQLDAHRFDLAATAACEFAWNQFCDWYVEFTKPIVIGDDAAAKAETQACTAWALGQILHLLHPFMPFVTEELWASFAGQSTLLMCAAWPVIAVPKAGEDARDEMNWVVRTISAIRTVRAELNVPAGAQIPLQVMGASAATAARLDRHGAVITRLARLSGIAAAAAAGKGAAQVIVDEATMILPLGDFIDLVQESKRLQKEGEKLAAEIAKLAVKLGNKDFTDRAPPDVVDEQRARKAEAEATLARLDAARKALTA